MIKSIFDIKRNSPVFNYITCSCIFYLLSYNPLNAQQFTMSSVGNLPGNTSNSNAIYFKGNSTCIKLESGITALNIQKQFGEFILNCEVIEHFNTLGLKVYPIPATSFTNVKFTNTPPLNEVFNISIYNAEGAIISSRKETGYNILQGVHLDLSSINAGSYILKISANQFVEAIKFIKTN